MRNENANVVFGSENPWVPTWDEPSTWRYTKAPCRLGAYLLTSLPQ